MILESKKLEKLLKLLIGISILYCINLSASIYFFRIDLTEEKRYTIKKATKDLLINLDESIYIDLYLEGELNSSFKRLQKNIIEILEEFKIVSDGKVEYTLYDPLIAKSNSSKNEFIKSLAQKGIQPTNVIDENNGVRIEKLIFPGAILTYHGIEKGVMLLGGNKTGSAEQKINQSIEEIEYILANAINQLTQVEKKIVAVLDRDKDKIDNKKLLFLKNELSKNYLVKTATLKNKVKGFDALLILKPTTSFSKTEKYYLDQYLMNGGKIMMLLDKLDVSMDSSSNKTNFAKPINLNLDDQLFKYGIRINANLILDNNALGYPVNVGSLGNDTQIKLIKWPYYPIFNNFSDHIITRNLDGVIGKFVNTIDTVKAENIKKTPLIFSSKYTKTINSPVNVTLEEMRKNSSPESYKESFLPIAYLLEGNFTSIFKNRFKPDSVETENYIDKSKNEAKLLVISDGDFGFNDIHPKTNNPIPLGMDQFSGVIYANTDFLLNAISYLIEENGLIMARNKKVKIRPLDKFRINDEKLFWQFFNILLPILIVIILGLIKHYWRKKHNS